MNLTFAANLTKMIDAGLGREAAPPETFVAVGRTTEYTDLGPVPIASFETNVEAALRALSVSMEPIQAGTGDPSPENVRPISGRSAVTVTRAGANLFGGNAFAQAILESCNSAATQSGNIVTLPNGSANVNSDIADRVKMMENLFSSGSYTIIIKQGESTATTPLISVFYTDGTISAITNSYYNSTEKYWRFVSNASKTIAFLRMNRDESGLHKYDVSKCGIFKGDVAYNAFEAYTEQTVTIQLGQTVYGGSLDVVSGVLTITRYFIDKTTWYKYAESGDYYAYRIGNLPPGIGNDDMSSKPMSNMVSVFGSFSSSAMTRNIIQPPRSSSGNAYMALHKDLDAKEVELTYLMATPVTVQLTPEQITTLIGQNNVWSDGGDVSLTYGTVKYTEGY